MHDLITVILLWYLSGIIGILLVKWWDSSLHTGGAFFTYKEKLTNRDMCFDPLVCGFLGGILWLIFLVYLLVIILIPNISRKISVSLWMRSKHNGLFKSCSFVVLVLLGAFLIYHVWG